MKKLLLILITFASFMVQGQVIEHTHVYAWDEGVYSTRFTGQDDCLGFDRRYSLQLADLPNSGLSLIDRTTERNQPQVSTVYKVVGGSETQEAFTAQLQRNRDNLQDHSQAETQSHATPYYNRDFELVSRPCSDGRDS